MQRLGTAAATAALAVLGAAAWMAGHGPQATAEVGPVGILWRADLEAARAEARKTGRPLLAVFR